MVDLGLRLDDVAHWKLHAEAVTFTSDPTENLELNGAIPEEVGFLRGNRLHEWSSRHYTGRRVELNAFTSDQFVKWPESKLKEQKTRKAVPDDKTLEQAYRRAASIHRYQEIINGAEQEVSAVCGGAEGSDGLEEIAHEATEPEPVTSLGRGAGWALPRALA